jgi:hypothetical protein
MIPQAMTAHVESQFEGFRKFERKRPPDCHKAASTAEIVVQSETGFTRSIGDFGKLAFRLAGRKDLP